MAFCQTTKRTFGGLTIPIEMGMMDGMTPKFVACYRVSTAKQGINGLGMDAQRDAVAKYLKGRDGTLIAEFAEVESGKRNQGQEMLKAIALCRSTGATLPIPNMSIDVPSQTTICSLPVLGDGARQAITG